MSKELGARSWIPGLDTIRFTLAGIVLLGHANIIGPLVDHNAGFFSKGIVFILGNSLVGVAAVIAFFIISGLVIHYPYRTGKDISYKEYFIKRYLRIGIPMLVIAIAAKVLSVDTDELPFWSLYCELIYYTLYPAIIWIRKKFGVSWLWFIISAFILSYLFLIVHGYDLAVFVSQQKQMTTNYHHLGPSATWIIGLPCWLIGVKLAAEYDDFKNNTVNIRAVWLARIVVLCVAMICSIARFHLALSYTLSMGAFSILAAWWIKTEIKYWNSKETIGIFEAGGKWSYSIYLCHVFPILYVREHGGTTTWFQVFYQVALAFVISFIFYILVEKPSHLLVKKIKFN